MIKCHLSKRGSKQKTHLHYCASLFFHHNRLDFFFIPWTNIWKKSDGVWQKCHFDSQFFVEYEPHFSTLMWVYWFHTFIGSSATLPLRSKSRVFRFHFNLFGSHHLFITLFSLAFESKGQVEWVGKRRKNTEGNVENCIWLWKIVLNNDGFFSVWLLLINRKYEIKVAEWSLNIFAIQIVNFPLKLQAKL